jgi:hypothetical protein
MSDKHVAVFGVYATSDLAENAVDFLLKTGFPKSAISVLLPDIDETSRGFTHEKHTKAPEGTAAGATTGGLIGGAFGLVIGLGGFAVPGLEPLVAAGPIIGALTGLGAGGALGGIIGAFIGLSIPEFEARLYDGTIESGGVLLYVHCTAPAHIAGAREALRETGAKDITSAEEDPSDGRIIPIRPAA